MTNETQAVQHGDAFRQMRGIWRRRKWVIVLAFLLPASILISLIAAMPDLYRARATVLIEPPRVAETQLQQQLPGVVETRLGAINEKVLSRSRLQELIDKYKLYPDLRRVSPDETVIERLRRDIGFERKDIDLSYGRAGTVAFTISYQGWDPRLSAQVANTLASYYVSENEKLRPHALGTAAATPNGPDRLAQLREELVELRTHFSDHYPDVMKVQQEIKALERWNETMANESAAPVAPVSGGNKQDDQFRVVDPAVPPVAPVAPNRLRLVLMALIGSLGLAGIAALLAEQFDTSFHRVDELWSFANTPILAGIPRIVTRGDAWRQRLRFTFTGVVVVVAIGILIRAGYAIGQGSEEIVWMLAKHVA
jgi:capsular polysaccharide biosynthesis protein